MWLLVAVLAALLAGLFAGYGPRFQATSLWAGKALAPPEFASAQPRGVQDALLNGPDAWLGVITPVLVLFAGVAAFVWAWWAILPVYFVFSATALVTERKLAPVSVDWYLLRLHTLLAHRAAMLARSGARIRTDAALTVDAALVELLNLYVGTGIPAPTMKIAYAAPHGDDLYLIELHCPKAAADAPRSKSV